MKKSSKSYVNIYTYPKIIQKLSINITKQWSFKSHIKNYFKGTHSKVIQCHLKVIQNTFQGHSKFTQKSFKNS